MNSQLLLLLALWASSEAAGQILFKRGVDFLEEEHFGLVALGRALASPMIWVGIVVHVVEFGLWIEILGRLPLSIAFPMESVSYAVVLVATRALLREAVPPRRWVGVGLICAGIVVLGTGA